MFAVVASGLFLLGIAVSSTLGLSQQPFTVAASNYDTYDAGLFSPMEDLSLLSTSQFTSLGHPAFPNYNVRIKKSDFCNGTVK